MYVCSCFGITEAQVKQYARDGRRTPRSVAGACRAGTDCGSCVKRIQALLGRRADEQRSEARPERRTVPCAVHGTAPDQDVAEAA